MVLMGSTSVIDYAWGCCTTRESKHIVQVELLRIS